MVKCAPEQETPNFADFRVLIVNRLFGDLEFRHNFYQNFLWTSVKTIAIEPVNPHGQKVLFKRWNVPKSRKTPNSCRFSYVIIHGLLGDLDSDIIFAKIFCGRPLKPLLWSKLALTAKTSNFEDQICPGSGKPPFCQFSCAIVHGLFDDLEFQNNLNQNFSWTSIKTLAMEPVSPHGQNVSI